MAAGPPKQGYSKLADWLNSHHGLQIFRSFDSLQTKNILYMQAQLTVLQAQLENIINSDEEAARNGVSEKKDFCYSWSALAQSDQDLERDNAQYEKFMEIRRLLKEYNDALLQRHRILQLTRAHSADCASLEKWLDHKDGGDRFLRGREREQYRQEYRGDFVSLNHNRSDMELFTRALYRFWLPAYHRIWGRHVKDSIASAEAQGIYAYSDKAILAWSRVIVTLLAALLPAASIFGLLFVKSILLRLVMITIFSVVFAALLVGCTKATMFEIFAASTAFAAVEVVFVSNLP